MVMIVFVILIYFNGLLVTSEGNYLPFLYPNDYSTLDNHNWYSTVSLPSPLKFGSTCHYYAQIVSGGYIHCIIYGEHFSVIDYINIAPYRDGISLSTKGEVRYTTMLPITNPSIFNQVNDYLSTSTGSSVSAEWILWAYWYDVCPNNNTNCSNTESNYFQVALAFQSNVTYAVFIYKCGLIRWTRYRATVGIYNVSGINDHHPLSNTDNVTDIDCYDVVSGWTNIVYRLDQGQRVLNEFKVASIRFDIIIVSWEVYPKENATLTLSITDSYQTVNSTINVTGYDNVYNYTEDIHLCNVYTFKLTLPKTETGCNNNIRSISTALTPKPENVSALYLNNETLVIKFQIHKCFNNEIQLFLAGTNGFNTSNPLDINSLQYIDEFYIVHWNIKLNRNSLYYLTVSAIGTYETSTSDVTEIIGKYNVKDIMIEKSEGIVCFVCVTEMFNECQVMIASVTTTLIPQSTQTNGTCYSFTDNGTYTVYAHDLENGLIILTPAVVIQYTVDWIEPSDTVHLSIESWATSCNRMLFSSNDSTNSVFPSITNTTNKNQSYTSAVLGGLFALSTCTGIILLIILVAILRKKGKTKTQVGIPVKTKNNLAYEMMEQSNEISISQNYSNSDFTNIGNTNVVPIYDDIPEEKPPPVPSRLYEDDEISTT